MVAETAASPSIEVLEYLSKREVVSDSSAIKRHLHVHLEMSLMSQATEAHPARNADGTEVKMLNLLPSFLLYSSFTDEELEILFIFTSKNLSTMQKQQQAHSQPLLKFHTWDQISIKMIIQNNHHP